MSKRSKKGMTTSRKGSVSGSSRQHVITKHALPVTEGLKSAETERQYEWHFATYAKWMDLEPDDLIKLDRETLELRIIEYLKHLRQKGLGRSSIASSLAAILHFCRVNAIWVNKDRLSLFIPDNENAHNDREYKRQEIERILRESDPRLRVVFLLLTNGMRIGAIPELQIGDIKAWPLPTADPEPQKVYQIWVYNRSKKGRYYTFVTPECATAIDDYLEFRKKNAYEDITKRTSPLIREQFPLYNKRDNAAVPRKIGKSSLHKTIASIIKKAGLDTAEDDIMLTHGFRKFAVTQMKHAKVDWSDREYLVGHRHSRGLDIQYDRTTEEERLVEWSKAINDLTIETDSYHLEKELQIYKDEYAKKIEQQANEIDSLRKQFLDYMKLTAKGDERLQKMFKDNQEDFAKKANKLGIKLD